MTTAAQRRVHEGWLRELTVIPTAAGREDRVIRWVESWVKARKNLRLRRDDAGNLIITRTPARKTRPIFITAHLDHPAFVVRRIPDPQTLDLEFRGGVHPPYFENAKIEIFDSDDRAHTATIEKLDAKAEPFKRATAKLARATDALQVGDIGRWKLRGNLPRVQDGILFTHACDDLAAVAAALGALNVLRAKERGPNVGVLLTRAEEVGFVGALAVCESKSVPKNARLICLENSRSFPDSPIGAGAILRVGDRMSVFHPDLTNRLGLIYGDHAAKSKSFRWQRKLMPGGACEATAFSEFGYESTCLCLPLGNYHNMEKIDDVLTGKRPARVGPEHIAIADFHSLIEMLIVGTSSLDAARDSPLKARLSERLRKTRFVLDQ